MISEKHPGADIREEPDAFCAQVQNSLLGGTDNSAPARAAARILEETIPDWTIAVQHSIGFAARAVSLAAMSGVQQFIVLGCGFPVPGAQNIHEVARTICPDARTVYVDNQHVVVSRVRACLAADKRVMVAEADLTRPLDVIKEIGDHIDLGKPVALLFSNVLHFFGGHEACTAVKVWKRHAARGSHLIVSHAASNFSKDELAAIRGIYADNKIPFRASAAVTIRDHYLKYWRMVDPAMKRHAGVVNVSHWGATTAEDTARPLILGGVAVMD